MFAYFPLCFVLCLVKGICLFSFWFVGCTCFVPPLRAILIFTLSHSMQCVLSAFEVGLFFSPLTFLSLVPFSISSLLAVPAPSPVPALNQWKTSLLRKQPALVLAATTTAKSCHPHTTEALTCRLRRRSLTSLRCEENCGFDGFLCVRV